MLLNIVMKMSEESEKIRLFGHFIVEPKGTLGLTDASRTLPAELRHHVLENPHVILRVSIFALFPAESIAPIGVNTFERFIK